MKKLFSKPNHSKRPAQIVFVQNLGFAFFSLPLQLLAHDMLPIVAISSFDVLIMEIILKNHSLNKNYVTFFSNQNLQLLVFFSLQALHHVF